MLYTDYDPDKFCPKCGARLKTVWYYGHKTNKTLCACPWCEYEEKI